MKMTVLENVIAPVLSLLGEKINQEYPGRLTKQQKERFLDFAAGELAARGFATDRLEIRHWGIMNRLLTTQAAAPKIIFMAHYDTPTIMPPGFSWIYRLFGHTRQGAAAVFMVLVIFALFGIRVWLEMLGGELLAGLYFALVGAVLFLPFLVPNPHNAEDNTSGVIALLGIAEWIKDKPFRDQVQLAFVDNEEWGLIGSNALKKAWEKAGKLEAEPVIINLDCVSRGEKPLLVYHKDDRIARELLPFVQANFPETEAFDMKGTPLSDNYTFREFQAIDISFTDPAIIPGGYYIGKIHAPSDRDFSPQKTAQLVAALGRYAADKLAV